MKDLAPAIAVSLVLHLLIAGALIFSWASEPQVHRVPKTPAHIQAVVIEKPAAKPAAPRPAEKPRPVTRPPQPTPPATPPKTVNTQPAVKKPEPPKAPPKPAPEKPQPPRINVPQLSLDDLMAQEDEAMQRQREEMQRQREEEERQARLAREQQEKDIAESQTYVDQIIALVSSRWIIPATARAKDSLKVEVRLQLLPGGEVIDVNIVKSSGDRSFDDSVVNAIRNAGKLPVPSGRLFQENFRNLRLEFNPRMVNP